MSISFFFLKDEQKMESGVPPSRNLGVGSEVSLCVNPFAIEHWCGVIFGSTIGEKQSLNFCGNKNGRFQISLAIN